MTFSPLALAFFYSAPNEDNVEKDALEMTGQGAASGTSSRADEDPFEKQMLLNYESQVRVSTSQTSVKTQTLDQLVEWIKEKPVPYTSNDKFSQEGILHYWAGSLSGHAHQPDVRSRTLMSLGFGNRSMVALYLEAG